MPVSVPPTPDTPWNREPRRRAGRGRPHLFRFAIIAFLLAATAGVAWFSVYNGFSPSSIFAGSRPAPLARLAPQPDRRMAPVTMPADVSAASVCVSSNRDSFGGSLTVGADESVCGNVSVYGGSATILGHVTGNVTIVGGSADVSGHVDGDLTTIGGSIDLHTGAAIGGNVNAIGGGITRAPGVTIGGNVEQGLAGRRSIPAHWVGLFDGSSFPWFHILFWALAGLCVAAFLPAPLRRVRDVMRREPAMSFVSGLAALFFGMVAALVLFVTCLGIPIALLLILGLWLAWIVGTVALGYWIGEGLLRLGSAHDHAPIIASVLGVTLLSLVESIPCFGGVVSFVAGLMGLGASMLALLYRRRAAGWRTRFMRETV